MSRTIPLLLLTLLSVALSVKFCFLFLVSSQQQSRQGKTEQHAHGAIKRQSTKGMSVPDTWNAGGLLVDSLQGINYANRLSARLMEREIFNNNITTVTMSPLLSNRNFNPKHIFSATWWQSVKRFKNMPVERVTFCEDAVFQAVYTMGEFTQFRLPTDWTEFAVEHLSRWWKVAQYDKEHTQTNHQNTKRKGTAYARIIRNLVHYTMRVLQPSKKSTTQELTLTATQQTLAFVAYLPYVSQTHPDWARRLTIVNVAASLASLMQYEFGRIVLFCDTEDYEFTRQFIWPQALRLLKTALDPSHLTSLHPEAILEKIERDVTSTTLGETTRLLATELQLIAAPTRYPHHKLGYSKMVPRKAVQDAYKALFGQSNNDSLNMTEVQALESFRLQWLGNDPNRWKYVYLTEPDTILMTKPHFLEQAKSFLDADMIFVPHRLQPVPHEYDFRTTAPPASNTTVDDADVPLDPPPQFYISAVGPFATVKKITQFDACCDSGYDDDPFGSKGNCGKFWHQCGFGGNFPFYNVSTVRSEALARWSRLQPYSFVQYVQGTRLVSLAGSEAGRMCTPWNIASDGPCPAVSVLTEPK